MNTHNVINKSTQQSTGLLAITTVRKYKNIEGYEYTINSIIYKDNIQG